jgi:hypothetical protein
MLKEALMSIKALHRTCEDGAPVSFLVEAVEKVLKA